MVDKTERQIAEAKLERMEELDEEVQDLLAEVDRKLERMNELEDEAKEILKDNE